MQVLLAKRQEGNYTRRCLKGLRDQNKEHIVNLCDPNNLETQRKSKFPRVDHSIHFLLKVQIT